MLKYLVKLMASAARVSFIVLVLSPVVLFANSMYQKSYSTPVEGDQTAPVLDSALLQRAEKEGVLLPSGEIRPLPDFPNSKGNLSHDQKLLFQVNLALAPTNVPILLKDIEDQLSIGIYLQTMCGQASCAIHRPRSVLSDSYQLQYYAPHFAPGLAGRYIMMHEIGHVMQYAYVDAKEMQEFFALFKKSPAWKECYIQPEQLADHGHLHNGQNCVHDREIFAEQFAYYSIASLRNYNGTFDALASGYGIPMLISEAEFKRLFDKATKS